MLRPPPRQPALQKLVYSWIDEPRRVPQAPGRVAEDIGLVRRGGQASAIDNAAAARRDRVPVLHIRQGARAGRQRLLAVELACERPAARRRRLASRRRRERDDPRHRGGRGRLAAADATRAARAPRRDAAARPTRAAALPRRPSRSRRPPRHWDVHVVQRRARRLRPTRGRDAARRPRRGRARGRAALLPLGGGDAVLARRRARAARGAARAGRAGGDVGGLGAHGQLERRRAPQRLRARRGARCARRRLPRAILRRHLVGRRRGPVLRARAALVAAADVCRRWGNRWGSTGAVGDQQIRPPRKPNLLLTRSRLMLRLMPPPERTGAGRSTIACPSTLGTSGARWRSTCCCATRPRRARPSHTCSRCAPTCSTRRCSTAASCAPCGACGRPS